MAEKVPFFTLFESFQAPRQLRLLLHDACAVSGVLDREARTLEVQIECGETLPQAAQDALQQMLAQQYDLRDERPEGRQRYGMGQALYREGHAHTGAEYQDGECHCGGARVQGGVL